MIPAQGDAEIGSLDRRRGKAVDNGGLRYGAMRARSARRYPPPPIRRSGPSFVTNPGGGNQTVLTSPVKTNIFISDPRKQTSGGRHQIGTPAGFKSESVAGFISECPVE